ncbi:MAG: hypothetical protein AAF590_06900 [Pseudomonadota bacterium]
MTVANIFVFSLGFCVACLFGVIACRMVWARAVRLTRTRLEQDRPETLRAFEARIAGAQARAAVSIRELERALEREQQMSAQARLMADQMASSSSMAVAERDDMQSSLVTLSDTLESTRERLKEHEHALARRDEELFDVRRELARARREADQKRRDVDRLELQAKSLQENLRVQFSDTDTVNDVMINVAELRAASIAADAEIETLRETIAQLREDKQAAENSAVRARLLLDAQDDREAVLAVRANFDAERTALTQRITSLEAELRKVRHPMPQLVSVNESLPSESLPGDHSLTDGRATSEGSLHEASLADANAHELDELRKSIDAMSASLTAKAALSPKGSKINALLDAADDDESELVTSLVEARDRLRSGSASSVEGTPEERAKAITDGTSDTTSKSANPVSGRTSSAGKKNAKAGKPDTSEPAVLVAATASGGQKARRRMMPKASKKDLNVV